MTDKKPLRIILECALKGATPEEFVRNFRYTLWCMRYIRLTLGHYVYASHINGPWFLDDRVPEERALGIDLSRGISNDNWHHWFADDLGALDKSTGTKAAYEEFIGSGRRYGYTFRLQHSAPEMWEAFCRGEWPPHTPGFEVACPA